MPSARPVKKARTNQCKIPGSLSEGLTVHSHPLGVRPSINAVLETCRPRKLALGPYFGSLPDELVICIIQDLEPIDLLHLGHSCRGLFAYSWFDELWKYLQYRRDSNSCPERWYGSWRRTFWQMPPDIEARVDCSGIVYSDVLYRPFQCSEIDYDVLLGDIEDANGPHSSSQIIPILDDNLTNDMFESEWHRRPFIIQHQKPIASWTMPDLVSRFGDVIFRQEYMDWNLKVYWQYMNENSDESPLYLFDCGSEAMSQLAKEYTIPAPEIFGSDKSDSADLFRVLGSYRPDHRWIIIGPKRSGSSFHKDPNGTCAWNSPVLGRKYWIMIDPSKGPPPGVLTDDEESEVTAPCSVAEWFLSGYYQEARLHPGFSHGICYPGQTMYVPSGWWHSVVNLDESIAITGNFVPAVKLHKVLEFLKTKPDQISGMKEMEDSLISSVHDMFVERLEKSHPQELEKALMQGKSKWQSLTAESQPFTFGFSHE